MPELPEVELVRREVEASALGRVISTVNVVDIGVLDGVSAEELERALTGHALTRTGRHGKQLFFRISKGGWLTVHLGMTGGLMFLEREEGPPRYSRVQFDFDDGGSLVFADMRKFGAIGLTASKASFLKQKRLGPDALTIERGDFVDRARRHRRPIKTVLLDQSVLAGVGNLYSDEVLFQCGVHPMALADGLAEDRLGCIHRNLALVLKYSLDVGTDFDHLPEGYMLKDRRPSSPCPKGHGPWHMMKVNGRTAYFCPQCQRL